MPFVYDKLFTLMKERGITKYQLRKERVSWGVGFREYENRKGAY